MNILLLTEAFPPAPVVGSFRAYKVARALKDGGHAVHVLTMSGGAAGEAAGGSFEEGITWERVSPWPGPRQWYGMLSRPFKRRASPPDRSHGSAEAPSARTRFGLRNALRTLITLPDDRQGFVPAALRAAWSRRGWAHAVYATSPSFSVLLAGRAVHRSLGIPWLAELRDPWIGNAGRDEGMPRSIARLDRWLEASCLKTASAIVLVSPMAADVYARRYGPQGITVVYALNGIDDLAAAGAPRTPGAEVRIVYAGSVYPPRDPTPLVSAVGRALHAAPREVRLTFVGSGDWEEAPQLASAVSSLPPCVSVERLSWLPQSEARAIIADADLLLLPAQEWVLQIPNKLYDYLGSRVPVLGLVEADSDTEKMLLAVGGHFVARTGSPAEQLSIVAASALGAAARGVRLDESLQLQEWTTSAQMSSLVELVERVGLIPTGPTASEAA